MASSTSPDDPSVPTRLLVLGLAHRNGDIVQHEVWPVTEACGLTADQVRSCLRRLVTEGLFVRRWRRSTVYRATDEGSAVLSSMMARHVLYARTLPAGVGTARGAWSRSRSPSRSAPLATCSAHRLLALGAAPVHNGLYVSPHRWDAEVDDEVRRLGIEEHAPIGTTDDLSVGGVSDPRALAAASAARAHRRPLSRKFIDT